MTAKNDHSPSRQCNWAQIKPLEENRIFVGCACCSSAGRFAHPGMVLAAGFGDCIVTKDGEYIYSEPREWEDRDTWTLNDAEKLAAADPDHDWRIEFIGALHGETYQRHMRGAHAGKWVCIESNQGFA